MADPITEVMEQVEVEGTYALASAHRDKVSLVMPGEYHTAFTGRLLGGSSAMAFLVSLKSDA